MRNVLVNADIYIKHLESDVDANSSLSSNASDKTSI